MPGACDSLLRDGLAVLGKLLPSGFTLGRSSLREKRTKTEAWIVVGRPSFRPVTCLLLARRRVEARDVEAIAAHAARSRHPVLLVSPSLPAETRKRLRGFGIGCWDLFGSAEIELRELDLSLQREGARAPARGGERALRSLVGEMTGRVVRVLVDVRPPYGLAELARCAQVESSCASRVAAFLAEAGLVRRPRRGKIEEVDWQALLRRWARDAPAGARGLSRCFFYNRGIPDFLARLGASGFLHALTGESAFARLAASGAGAPSEARLYVDEVEAAVAQFDLHPAEEGGNVTLIKPADRSVFARSSEASGLRHASPSLMAVDMADEATFEFVLGWMAEHESAWRVALAF